MVTADEKTAALSTNYTDPFADTLKNLQNNQLPIESEIREGSSVYEAPLQGVSTTLIPQPATEKEYMNTPLQCIPEREPFQNQDTPRTGDP